MNTFEVKKILEFNESVSKYMNDYLKKYVEWVKNNVPPTHWDKFKVGLVVECPRVGGRWYGLEGLCCNKDGEWEMGYNTVNFTGYAWEQLGYYVYSLSREEKLNYIKNIPSIMENAFKEIQSESDEIDNIKKIDFESIRFV